ncbi:hypothetical protein SAMN05216511_6134 [Streptomyces sp. KS_16]|nr:hypothetical protein BX261_1083 [Streptomyces sp. 2321.6]SDR55932.1 hypothetical protein SAMN05216511_6134 [Streptomyces sp. KS_16]SEC06310.1 hypothetical protein SAMN05428940_1082 [Streptomyces sp. 2133.1]SNC64340.1 hypothetical protein SAMN06272741_1081 [Streptomyces sp. 2114.4]
MQRRPAKDLHLPERREIKKIAKSRPAGHGLPFSTWSLAKPADFLAAEGWSTTSATRAFGSCSGRRRFVSTHEDLEDVPRPCLCRQEGPGRAPLRDRRRRGHTRGRRARSRLVPGRLRPAQPPAPPGRQWAERGGRHKDPDGEPRPRRRATYTRPHGVRPRSSASLSWPPTSARCARQPRPSSPCSPCCSGALCPPDAATPQRRGVLGRPECRPNGARSCPTTPSSFSRHWPGADAWPRGSRQSSSPSEHASPGVPVHQRQGSHRGHRRGVRAQGFLAQGFLAQWILAQWIPHSASTRCCVGASQDSSAAALRGAAAAFLPRYTTTPHTPRRKAATAATPIAVCPAESLASSSSAPIPAVA